ncbi:hypothetical protein PLANTIT3_60394 [Plantibacter sp. T3]|nr:hypothetical protein PLANTIT3_60394 [Plantibacter sp. T3]
MLREERHHRVAVGADGSGHETGARHDLADAGRGLLERRHEAHVAVRDDTDEHTLVVDDREARDAELTAQFVDLGDGGVGRGGDRVRDHARLAPLHAVDLFGLVGDRQVAVQDADAALASHRDRHAGLGHGVHRARQQRRVHGDPLRQAGRGLRLARDDVGVPGQQQHIVICESYESERIRLVHLSLS